MTSHQLKQELQLTLNDALHYWSTHTVDYVFGGFAGAMNDADQPDEKAPKSAMLNCSLLWSYSAAYNLNRNIQHLQLAERAFKYVRNHFVDKKLGGIYWTVDYLGDPLDHSKRVAALAMAISALSEYVRASEDNEPKVLALKLYNDLIKHFYNDRYGGYAEAFSNDWKNEEDLEKLSDVVNERTTRGQLNVLQAFANLYRIWPDADLKKRLTDLLWQLGEHMIDPVTGHLYESMYEDWTPKSSAISPLLDLEASWLLLNATEIIQDYASLEAAKKQSLLLASVAIEELHSAEVESSREEEQSSEKMEHSLELDGLIGLYNAYQLTDNEAYLQQVFTYWPRLKERTNQNNTQSFKGATGQQESASAKRSNKMISQVHTVKVCIEIIRRMV